MLWNKYNIEKNSINSEFCALYREISIIPRKKVPMKTIRHAEICLKAKSKTKKIETLFTEESFYFLLPQLWYDFYLMLVVVSMSNMWFQMCLLFTLVLAKWTSELWFFFTIVSLMTQKRFFRLVYSTAFCACKGRKSWKFMACSFGSEVTILKNHHLPIFILKNQQMRKRFRNELSESYFFNGIFFTESFPLFIQIYLSSIQKNFFIMELN